ncbi:MAG TPA: class I SAM-dependent methyltransferase [Stellaceae bacterium]|nr:class I SAM-dependent methyltransferase [Stellaceae bacterium]
MAEFSSFDTRHYPTLPVRDGYREWAPRYEATVLDLMDIRLLASLHEVAWRDTGRAVDLACGTGRIGRWLRAAGVAAVDGVDFAPEMLSRAEACGAYDRLVLGDMRATGLDTGDYALVTEVLADEHLADLAPLYREAARLAERGGRIVIAGYHPHFLMQGIPTHFDRPSGEAVAIESHVHLMSDHIAAAHGASLQLAEMIEGVVDDAWIAAKPGWRRYRHHPVSFAMVWVKPRR